MADPDGNPNAMSLTALAHSCVQHTFLFFEKIASDTRYCFEIFRRAIVEKDEQAWTFLQEIYQEQLRRWVRRHPSFRLCQEEEDYFAGRAMAKFWQAMSPAQFAGFPDISRLLSYLQMCVNSAVYEYLRAQARAKLDVDLEEAETCASGEDLEEQVLSRKQGRDLWRLVMERLNGQKEIRVAYDSFQLDLKPADIYKRYPDLYESTQEVYRIKENILNRLRRDTEILKTAGFMPESRGKLRSSQ